MNADKKYNILYVDDEQSNLRMFKNLYRRSYNIHTAASGKEGLEILENHHIHLVISDQRMPKMTGLEFLRKAKKKWSDIPLILLTGYTDHDVLKEAVNEIGIYRYINKPFDDNDMANVMGLAFETYQLQLDNAKVQRELHVRQELVESEIQKRMIIETALDAVVTTDETSVIIDWNTQAESIFGWRKDEAIGNLLTELVIPDEYQAEHLAWLKQFLDPRKIKIAPRRKEMEAKRKTGELFPVEVSITPLQVGGSMLFSAFLRDITERKNAGERLVAAILQTEDRERKRIAKEIHDSLGQNLTVTVMNFDAIKKEINQLDDLSRKKFETGMTFLNRAINDSRTIAHNLMPKAIDDFGYVLSVESILEGLKDSSGTHFHFYNNLDQERLSPGIELALFRITQEATNNILKYAKAETATIQLMKYSDMIILTIEDDES
ncbi:MAG: PAS domain S-box protein [Bacteroidetes bacterium]|nr:PAS domain S-box protein [Bacteroidota bacterium]